VEVIGGDGSGRVHLLENFELPLQLQAFIYVWAAWAHTPVIDGVGGMRSGWQAPKLKMLTRVSDIEKAGWHCLKPFIHSSYLSAR